MQILLASAKIMKSETSLVASINSIPIFLKEAQTLARELSEYTIEELTNLLKCSVNIALENKLRYQDFMNQDACLPAIFAYYGQVYKCLKVDSLTTDNLIYAQKHLFILSFLYGILRPLDNIHPYRLEGNVVLKSTNFSNIFAYWKPLLTDVLIDKVKKDDGILLHLATEEFQHLFDWKRILSEVHVIKPLFMINKGSKLKIISMYAKSCRGAMANYIIKNKINTISQLLKFEYNGFVYERHYGDKDNPHFILDSPIKTYI
jgi:hypothetical protein